MSKEKKADIKGSSPAPVCGLVVIDPRYPCDKAPGHVAAGDLEHGYTGGKHGVTWRGGVS